MSRALEARIRELERAMWPERFCEHVLEYGQVPCPDGNLGCMVYHHGWRCAKCRTPLTPDSESPAHPESTGDER